MKAIITAVALASLFGMTACNRAERRQQELTMAAQQRTIDSISNELAKQQVIDSMNEVARVEYVLPQNVMPATVTEENAVAAASAPRKTTARKSTARHTTSTSRSSNNTYAASSPAPVYQAPVEQKKKGWSAKAKGAVIGAGTGAAAGAIINGRNRAAGAVIGGILGAGAGTGIGAVIDKKNGR